MQESPFEQRRREKFVAQGIEQGTKEATLKSLMTVLHAKFHGQAVRAIDPALQDIDDLQRLEQLLRTAANAENLEAFTKILFE